MLEENVIFSKIMKACIHNTLAFVNDLKKNHNKWGLQSSSSSIFFLTVFFLGGGHKLRIAIFKPQLRGTFYNWHEDLILYIVDVIPSSISNESKPFESFC